MKHPIKISSFLLKFKVQRQHISDKTGKKASIKIKSDQYGYD